MAQPGIPGTIIPAVIEKRVGHDLFAQGKEQYETE